MQCTIFTDTSLSFILLQTRFSKRTSTTTANTEQKQAAVSRNETKRTKANEGGQREREQKQRRELETNERIYM